MLTAVLKEEKRSTGFAGKRLVLGEAGGAQRAIARYSFGSLSACWPCKTCSASGFICQ